MSAKTAGRKSVCLIGSSGSGKSTFLAGLELLGGPDSHSRYALSVHKGGKDLAESAAILRRGEWLPRTEGGFEVAGRLSRAGRSAVSLRTRDYDGSKALLPAEDEEVSQMLAEADVVLLVLGADHAAAEAERVLTRPGGGATSKYAEETTVLKALRARRDHDGSNARKHPPVVAVVLTKADANPALQDGKSAREFLESNAPVAYRKLLELSPDLAVFPVSAVGGVQEKPGGGIGPKQPPMPRGYDELFEWTFAQLEDRRRKWLRYVALVTVLLTMATVAVLLGGGKTWLIQKTKEAKRKVNDPTQSLPDRIVDVVNGGDRDVAEVAVAIVRKRLNEINAELSRGAPEGELKSFLVELAALRKSGLAAVASELVDAETAVGKKLRDTGLARLRAGYRPGVWDEKLRQDVLNYAKEFSGTPEAGEANKMLAEMSEAERQEARRAIIAQQVPDRDNLARKVRLITDYMAKYREIEPRKGEIDRAVRVANGLLERKTYKVTLLASGTFDEARSHIVKFVFPEQSWSFEATGPRVKDEQWDREFELTWTAGDFIQIELWLFHGSSIAGKPKQAAVFRFNEQVALLKLVEPVSLTAVNGWGFASGPSVQCRVKDLDSEDANCVRQFLTTSDGWAVQATPAP